MTIIHHFEPTFTTSTVAGTLSPSLPRPMVAGDAPPRPAAAARADARRARWRPTGLRGAEATAEVPWRPGKTTPVGGPVVDLPL